jgi:hypothetical protein
MELLVCVFLVYLNRSVAEYLLWTGTFAPASQRLPV